jgi:hypothetical protein
MTTSDGKRRLMPAGLSILRFHVAKPKTSSPARPGTGESLSRKIKDGWLRIPLFRAFGLFNDFIQFISHENRDKLLPDSTTLILRGFAGLSV